MAEIRDCKGKKVKISKNSITIKNDDGKTCGVVQNIISLADMQANKQIVYYGILKKMGLHGKISIKDVVIKDNEMFIFRNIKSKLFFEKYGYFSEEKKKKAEEEEALYNDLKTAEINVIECIYI